MSYNCQLMYVVCSELRQSKSNFEERLKEFTELTARMEGCGQVALGC